MPPQQNVVKLSKALLSNVKGIHQLTQQIRTLVHQIKLPSGVGGGGGGLGMPQRAIHPFTKKGAFYSLILGGGKNALKSWGFYTLIETLNTIANRLIGVVTDQQKWIKEAHAFNLTTSQVYDMIGSTQNLYGASKTAMEESLKVLSTGIRQPELVNAMVQLGSSFVGTNQASEKLYSVLRDVRLATGTNNVRLIKLGSTIHDYSFKFGTALDSTTAAIENLTDKFSDWNLIGQTESMVGALAKLSAEMGGQSNKLLTKLISKITEGDLDTYGQLARLGVSLDVNRMSQSKNSDEIISNLKRIIAVGGERVSQFIDAMGVPSAYMKADIAKKIFGPLAPTLLSLYKFAKTEFVPVAERQVKLKTTAESFIETALGPLRILVSQVQDSLTELPSQWQQKRILDPMPAYLIEAQNESIRLQSQSVKTDKDILDSIKTGTETQKQQSSNLFMLHKEGYEKLLRGLDQINKSLGHEGFKGTKAVGEGG